MMQLPFAFVVDFALVVARTFAWLVAAPVFGDRGLSNTGRIAVALSLGVFLTPMLGPTGSSELPAGAFLLLVIGQIVVGLLLGWVIGVLLSAFELAGHHIDLISGFSVSMLFDPMSGSQSGVFTRFSRLVFMTLIFATGAYQTLIGGFVLSFRAVPLDRLPGIVFDMPSVVTLFGTMTVASLQIAAPVLGALFLTEVTLAMAQRFAPTANVFVLGLSVKTMITLVVLGSSLTFYPLYFERLISIGQRAGMVLVGG